jgi:hypothetical protein
MNLSTEAVKISSTHGFSRLFRDLSKLTKSITIMLVREFSESSNQKSSGCHFCHCLSVVSGILYFRLDFLKTIGIRNKSTKEDERTSNLSRTVLGISHE